jgi:hypothetical protein
MDFNKRASNVPRGCGERITRMERPQQLLCSFRSCMSSCRGAVGRVTDESMFEVHVREHGQALIHLREADVRLLLGHLTPGPTHGLLRGAGPGRQVVTFLRAAFRDCRAFFADRVRAGGEPPVAVSSSSESDNSSRGSAPRAHTCSLHASDVLGSGGTVQGG